MIDGLLGFIFGFALCLAFWLRRSIEQRHAFNAALEQIEALHEREKRYRETLSNIRALAQRSMARRNSDLDGRALLPAPAEPAGQRLSLQYCNGLAGPSRNGGPDLSRRER